MVLNKENPPGTDATNTGAAATGASPADGENQADATNPKETAPGAAPNADAGAND